MDSESKPVFAIAKPYFLYWGKASLIDDESIHHLFPYHSLDVAAVAACWWEQSTAIKNRFMYVSGLSEAETRAWVLFFVALHDLGKLDIRFQLKAPNVIFSLWPELTEDDVELSQAYYHGPEGFFSFRRELASLPGCDFDNIADWLKAVCGHHGELVFEQSKSGLYAEDWIIDRDRQARKKWVEWLSSFFLVPEGIDFTSPLPDCPMELLAGFCSVCDWLGSNSDTFTYCSQESSLERYWQETCEKADVFLREMGVSRQSSGLSGMTALYPEYKPRQLQILVDQLPLTSALTLIEAPTGSGKTETALAYASKLLAAGMVDSIIFALPTQATANAMLERLEVIAHKLFADSANVILAHGKARFNQGFAKIIAEAVKPDAQRRDAAQVQCADWLAQSRKRVFLGQIGVCTIDQVLVSALPVRHNFVRSFGLQKSLLIIDEVHAYDAYMYGLLNKALESIKQAGGSAVLLSATLPFCQKQKLANQWSATLRSGNAPQAELYPLITQVYGNAETGYFALDDPKQQPQERQVTINLAVAETCLPDSGLITEMIEAAQKGALVGMVCNLVTDAQQLYKALKVEFLQRGCDVQMDLFHSRYCYKDRDRIEKNVLAVYGKKGVRGQGRILVATQVIEQSLDLDFDWLITQLCPADLLFQRLGRLHRHQRKNRPEGFAAPKATVITPEGDDFGLHQVVYTSAALLWRTRELLITEGQQINFPKAYRDWIERVYREDPWSEEPESVQQSHADYQVKGEAAYFCARQLSDANYRATADSENNLLLMTRDGDRSLNVLLLAEEAGEKKLLSGEALTAIDEWYKSEALQLNTVAVPSGWQRWLPKAEADGIVHLILKQQEGQWCWQGEKALLVYTANEGLVKYEL